MGNDASGAHAVNIGTDTAIASLKVSQALSMGEKAMLRNALKELCGHGAPPATQHRTVPA